MLPLWFLGVGGSTLLLKTAPRGSLVLVEMASDVLPKWFPAREIQTRLLSCSLARLGFAFGAQWAIRKHSEFNFVPSFNKNKANA